MIADILGDRMGCLLFQLPPSYCYTITRLGDIVSQLDPLRRNVVELRHVSWWNDEVYDAFREAGIIFCSCSGPRLPDELIRTADEVYVRLHGPKRWYRHDYSKDELTIWAERIKANGRKEPGSISITIMTRMPPKTRRSCGGCLDEYLRANCEAMELCHSRNPIEVCRLTPSPRSPGDGRRAPALSSLKAGSLDGNRSEAIHTDLLRGHARLANTPDAFPYRKRPGIFRECGCLLGRLRQCAALDVVEYIDIKPLREFRGVRLGLKTQRRVLHRPHKS